MRGGFKEFFQEAKDKSEITKGISEKPEELNVKGQSGFLPCKIQERLPRGLRRRSRPPEAGPPSAEKAVLEEDISSSKTPQERLPRGLRRRSRKAVLPKGDVGSNPTLSAMHYVECMVG